MIRRVLLALLSLAAVGCASAFQETHYFQSRASLPTIPNYYRLTVEGYSLISSSRYVSGYFDEDTISTYFNEYVQPAGAALVPVAKAPAARASAASAGSASVEPVAKGLQGQKLIMILSSNSDEIATQIGALAASKQFTASLAGLIARDQYAAADAAESRVTIEKSRAKATASLASQLVAGLPDDATTATAEQQLLAFINALAADLGYDGAFADLNGAAQWLDFNRARLLRSDR